MLRIAVVFLLFCVSAIGSACDRGAEKEMPRLAARRETAEEGPFRNLGKRSSSQAPQFDASSRSSGAAASQGREPASL